MVYRSVIIFQFNRTTYDFCLLIRTGYVTGLQTSANAGRVTKETSGDRIRIKAPKIEFHLTAPGDWSGYSKYREAPVMTLVSTEDWQYLVKQINLAAGSNPAHTFSKYTFVS